MRNTLSVELWSAESCRLLRRSILRLSIRSWPWEEDKVVDMHKLVGATTQGVAVRGSTKKK